MTKSLKEVLQMHRAASLKGKYEDRSKQINGFMDNCCQGKINNYKRYVPIYQVGGSAEICRIVGFLPDSDRFPVVGVSDNLS